MTEDNQDKRQQLPGDDIISDVTGSEYKYGFVTDIDTDLTKMS